MPYVKHLKRPETTCSITHCTELIDDMTNRTKHVQQSGMQEPVTTYPTETTCITCLVRAVLYFEARAADAELDLANLGKTHTY